MIQRSYDKNRAVELAIESISKSWHFFIKFLALENWLTMGDYYTIGTDVKV